MGRNQPQESSSGLQEQITLTQMFPNEPTDEDEHMAPAQLEQGHGDGQIDDLANSTEQTPNPPPMHGDQDKDETNQSNAAGDNSVSLQNRIEIVVQELQKLISMADDSKGTAEQIAQRLIAEAGGTYAVAKSQIQNVLPSPEQTTFLLTESSQSKDLRKSISVEARTANGSSALLQLQAKENTTREVMQRLNRAARKRGRVGDVFVA